MLSLKHRLNREDFQKTISVGRSFKSNYFYLKILPNDVERIRAGVGVSKKLAKKATQKNYYKRLMRHVLKEALPRLNTGYDAVIIAGDNVKGKKFDKLVDDAKTLFKKTNIF
jgi:ribonuclease P protein component